MDFVMRSDCASESTIEFTREDASPGYLTYVRKKVKSGMGVPLIEV